MRRLQAINEKKEKGELNSLIPSRFIKDSKAGVYPQLGFEFEFYSNKSQSFIKRGFEAIVKDEVKILDTPNKQNELFYYVQLDYSGGKNMYEFVTPPSKMPEAISLLDRIFAFIDENGYTNDKCAFQFNYSINNVDISKINPLKLCLNFDEEFVFKRFPGRRGNLYTQSVNTLIPKALSATDPFSMFSYNMPTDKYYGINFLKLKKNYLEVRYLGGVDYEKRYSDICEIIDYFHKCIVKVLSEGDLTSEEKAKLKGNWDNARKVMDAMTSYESFRKQYPNIDVFINTNPDEKLMPIYWRVIASTMEPLVLNGMKKGKINWDSDRQAIEVVDSEVGKMLNLISNVRFIKCEIQANLSNCEVYQSIVADSHHNGVQFFSTKVHNSKIMDCKFDERSEIDRCYVDGATEVSCEVRNTMLRNFIPMQGAIVYSDSEVMGIDDTKYFK